MSQSLFSIGGRVTQTNGEGLGGVVIALNGAQSQTTTTDANGYYSFANLEQGSNYTVLPTKAGYTFNPPSQSVNGLVSNQTLNFTALPITSGNVLISEFRLRGPNGSNDEFIELYNNTNSPITVGALDGSSGWALVAANGVTVFTLPNNTTIPARAHYLVVNSNPVGGYSLGSYAAGDNAYVVDILDDTGIALFKTSNPSNFTLENRLDAVGFNNGFTPVPELYREGSGLPPIGAVVAEHSWVRKIITVGGVPRTGLPQDMNENASDFVLISPTAETFNGVASMLGAPGPENLASPTQRNAQITATLVDPAAGIGASANRQRLYCDQPGAPACADVNPNTSTAGYLAIRRTYTNRTGKAVTRLRFRIVDITAGTAPAGTADLRAVNSPDVMVPTVTGGTVLVRGTTLEMAPNQPNGGGANSSLSAGAITLETPLAAGSSIRVQFLLGIKAGGNFRFLVNAEALP